jgi:hypothetical protein
MPKLSKRNISRKYQFKQKSIRRKYVTKKQYRFRRTKRGGTTYAEVVRRNFSSIRNRNVFSGPDPLKGVGNVVRDAGNVMNGVGNVVKDVDLGVQKGIGTLFRGATNLAINAGKGALGIGVSAAEGVITHVAAPLAKGATKVAIVTATNVGKAAFGTAKSVAKSVATTAVGMGVAAAKSVFRSFKDKFMGIKRLNVFRIITIEKKGWFRSSSYEEQQEEISLSLNKYRLTWKPSTSPSPSPLKEEIDIRYLTGSYKRELAHKTGSYFGRQIEYSQPINGSIQTQTHTFWYEDKEELDDFFSTIQQRIEASQKITKALKRDYSVSTNQLILPLDTTVDEIIDVITKNLTTVSAKPDSIERIAENVENFTNITNDFQGLQQTNLQIFEDVEIPFELLCDIAYNVYPSNKIKIKTDTKYGYVMILKTATLQIYQPTNIESNIYLLGVRGTEFVEFDDIMADIKIGRNRSITNTKRCIQDIETVRAFVEEPENSDIFLIGIGHSLGGAINDELLNAGLIEYAVSFNPAVQKKHVVNNTHSLHTRYYIEHDPIYKLLLKETEEDRLKGSDTYTRFIEKCIVLPGREVAHNKILAKIFNKLHEKLPPALKPLLMSVSKIIEMGIEMGKAHGMDPLLFAQGIGKTPLPKYTTTPPPLPDGVREGVDPESGLPVYYDDIAKTTSWDRPLPAGWQQTVDTSGSTVYYNTNDTTTRASYAEVLKTPSPVAALSPGTQQAKRTGASSPATLQAQPAAVALRTITTLPTLTQKPVASSTGKLNTSALLVAAPQPNQSPRASYAASVSSQAPRAPQAAASSPVSPALRPLISTPSALGSQQTRTASRAAASSQVLVVSPAPSALGTQQVQRPRASLPATASPVSVLRTASPVAALSPAPQTRTGASSPALRPQTPESQQTRTASPVAALSPGTQQTRPPAAASPVSLPASRAGAAATRLTVSLPKASSSSLSSMTQRLPQVSAILPESTPLPFGWIQLTNLNGKFYYENKYEDVNQWPRPTESIVTVKHRSIVTSLSVGDLICTRYDPPTWMIITGITDNSKPESNNGLLGRRPRIEATTRIITCYLLNNDPDPQQGSNTIELSLNFDIVPPWNSIVKHIHLNDDNSLEIKTYTNTTQDEFNVSIIKLKRLNKNEYVSEIFEYVNLNIEFLCKFMEDIRLKDNIDIINLPMVQFLIRYYNHFNINNSIYNKCKETRDQYHRNIAERQQFAENREHNAKQKLINDELARVTHEKEVSLQREYYIRSVQVGNFIWYNGSWAYVYYSVEVDRVIGHEEIIHEDRGPYAPGGYEPKLTSREPTKITCGLLLSTDIIINHSIDIQIIPTEGGNYWKYIELSNGTYEIFTYSNSPPPTVITSTDRAALILIFTNLENTITALQEPETLRKIVNHLWQNKIVIYEKDYPILNVALINDIIRKLETTSVLV